MGRTPLNLIIVRLRKIQDAKTGKNETVAVLPIEYIESVINKKLADDILPRVEKAYVKLIQRLKDQRNIRALDDFFREIPPEVCIGNLGWSLIEDLKITPAEAWNLLANTTWTKELVNSIKSEFRKTKKNDPVKYAEAVLRLVEIFGLTGTRVLLMKNGVKIATSTLEELYKIGMDTPKVKKLIQNGEINLTDMFWIKGDKNEREKVATRIASLRRGRLKSKP
jgi:hypothetical protein